MYDDTDPPLRGPRAAPPLLLAHGLTALLAFAGACDSAPIVVDDAGARSSAAAAATTREAPARAPRKSAGAGHDWNDAQIAWQPYESGLARAKAEGKPVCLVVYTTWCPHCLNYSRVFHDPRVVERARDFVMVRADADSETAVAEQHAPDGGYIPRTFFLSSSGVMDADIRAPRDRFRYFYDERDPSALLAGMATAIQKLKQ